LATVLIIVNRLEQESMGNQKLNLLPLLAVVSFGRLEFSRHLDGGLAADRARSNLLVPINGTFERLSTFGTNERKQVLTVSRV
jgi:hypothetical protein